MLAIKETWLSTEDSSSAIFLGYLYGP